MPGPIVAGSQLPLTGERTVPGIDHENYWFRRHEVAYLAAAAYVAGANLLEAGCGEGYGAEILRVSGATVTCLDYDEMTTHHVSQRYPHLRAVRGDLQRLPFADGGFTAVVNLQVVEHLHDQPGFIRECARTLAPGGLLVISTPNRLTFSPGRDSPLNPFHTRELTASELSGLLDPWFSVVDSLGIHHGPRIDIRPGLVGELIATAPDDWDDELSTFVSSIAAEDFVVGSDDLDASLDLFTVAKRR